MYDTIPGTMVQDAVRRDPVAASKGSGVLWYPVSMLEKRQPECVELRTQGGGGVVCG